MAARMQDFCFNVNVPTGKTEEIKGVKINRL